MSNQYPWAAFTDAEIAVLFDALTTDDGARYGVECDDQPTYKLTVSLIQAAVLRGFDDELDWGAVVDASDVYQGLPEHLPEVVESRMRSSGENPMADLARRYPVDPDA